jgi:glucose-6-phosphate isomerase
VIVTTKSGGTPETRNGMLEVQHRFEQLGLDFPSCGGGHDDRQQNG